MRQGFTSANTSINSNKPAAAYNNGRVIDLIRNKSVLDYGGGKYDIAISYGKDNYNADISIYDLYNRTTEHNARVLSHTYDVVICNNVLNVIDSNDVRIGILQDMSHYADIIIISVYEGNRSGIPTFNIARDTWQANMSTADYMPLIKSALPGYTINRYGKIIIASK